MRQTTSGGDRRLITGTILTVAALVALRLVAAAFTPLTFDEAYYWMWSKSLSGGYYDHPPMVAFVIRAGTMIAGDTELGVRLVSILLALPMTFAIWRAAEILFGGTRVAASAAILLNITLVAAVGTLIVTPDAPVNDVKKAQTKAVTMAGPPRRLPKSALKRRTRRRAAPPSARK